MSLRYRCAEAAVSAQLFCKDVWILTESELVDGCRKGEREAQRELYARTCERIYALLLRMTRHPEDAFDLAQDTYLRAFARIGQFDGRSSLATWLYSIAVTQALSSSDATNGFAPLRRPTSPKPVSNPPQTRASPEPAARR